MEYNQVIEELWYVLLGLDRSWRVQSENDTEIVLTNRFGVEIHANSEESAIRAAIGLEQRKEE